MAADVHVCLRVMYQDGRIDLMVNYAPVRTCHQVLGVIHKLPISAEGVSCHQNVL